MVVWLTLILLGAQLQAAATTVFNFRWGGQNMTVVAVIYKCHTPARFKYPFLSRKVFLKPLSLTGHIAFYL
jgi:hypothetical protein